MKFLDDIFFALWFFLPAGLANMFPIFVAHMPGLKNFNYPVDFYKYFRGQRVFGDNKTIRGFITAGLVGVLVVMVQKMVYGGWTYLQEISPINYSLINPVILGLLLGCGAILGDAIESFFKRQLHIPAGSSWLFFDQIDYVLGGILLSLVYVQLEFRYYIYIVIIYFVLHLISAAAGYWLGLKSKPL